MQGGGTKSDVSAKTLSSQKSAEVRASFAAQGLMRTLGAEMTALAPGWCRLEMAFADAVSQQMGFFHGGAIGALADSAGGYAALTRLPLGSEIVSVEYKINFLRPAAGNRLIAEGTVLRAGRSLVVVRVDVQVDSGGRRILCAASQQSLMAFSAGDASGASAC
jgi:uncharacterized protein (TIGR00369 family)